MLLSELEKDLLTAWSNGQCGASARVAKRAWLILQECARTNPFALAEAYGSSTRASQWIRRYRCMGPIGLLDHPRTGRPASVRDRVALQGLSSRDEEAVGDTAVEQFLRLDKPAKEAVWRENRLHGRTLIRGRRTMDVPLSAPREYPDLAGLLLLPGLVSLAVIEKSHQVLSSEQGVWMSITGGTFRDVLNTVASGGRTYDLLSVLRMKNTASEEGSSPNGSKGKQLNRLLPVHENHLRRWVWSIDKLSHAVPKGRMSILICGDTTQGLAFMRLLTLCAEHRLWTNVDVAHPSRLRRMTVACGELAKAAFFGQSVLSMASIGSGELAELLAHGVNEDCSPFCWTRTV